MPSSTPPPSDPRPPHVQRLRALVLTALMVGGLVATDVALRRWAPEATLRAPDRGLMMARAASASQALGYRIRGTPQIQVSAGIRTHSNSADIGVLLAHEHDPARRRRLLAAAPPVRIGVRYWQAQSPGGLDGALLLEYDGDGRMVGATFGLDGVLTESLALESDRFDGGRLARLLLARAPPTPKVFTAASRTELLYPGEHGEPSAYVYLTDRGAWGAFRVPVPYRLMDRQSQAWWRQSAGLQVRFYSLFAAGLLAFGVLLWRLSKRRAGLGHSLPLLAVLVLAVLPGIRYFQSQPAVLVVIGLGFLLPQLGLLLAWAAAEGEVREVRPGAVEHWDRLMFWQPTRGTGRNLLLGVAVGCGLAGVLAASGRIAEAVRGAATGGYADLTVILPDYWLLSSPVNWGVTLATATAFLVGLGGRLGGRPGAMVGAAVSAFAWSYAVPAGPTHWAAFFGLVASMTAGWVLWHFGLLALVAMSVTALCVPTAWFAWHCAPLLLDSAIIASLPAALAVLGLVCARRAPSRAAAQPVVPTYVSQLEQETRLRAEVDLLRTFQLSLLPPACPDVGADIAWKMVPADLVGGDYLDVIEDDDGRLWLAMADVAGHGVSCSVVTAFLKAAVTQHAVAGRGPALALAGIRNLFARLENRRTLVTLLLGVWDPVSCRFQAASAGHPPFLLAAEGMVRELGPPGLPLGLTLGRTSGTAEREAAVDCTPGTVVVAYTDGVVEAESPEGEPMGYDHWPELLAEVDREPASILLERLLAAVDAHRAGRAQADDISALVIRLSGTG